MQRPSSFVWIFQGQLPSPGAIRLSSNACSQPMKLEYITLMNLRDHIQAALENLNSKKLALTVSRIEFSYLPRLIEVRYMKFAPTVCWCTPCSRKVVSKTSVDFEIGMSILTLALMLRQDAYDSSEDYVSEQTLCRSAGMFSFLASPSMSAETWLDMSTPTGSLLAPELCPAFFSAMANLCIMEATMIRLHRTGTVADRGIACSMCQDIKDLATRTLDIISALVSHPINKHQAVTAVASCSAAEDECKWFTHLAWYVTLILQVFDLLGYRWAACRIIDPPSANRRGKYGISELLLEMAQPNDVQESMFADPVMCKEMPVLMNAVNKFIDEFVDECQELINLSRAVNPRTSSQYVTDTDNLTLPTCVNYEPLHEVPFSFLSTRKDISVSPALSPLPNSTKSNSDPMSVKCLIQ